MLILSLIILILSNSITLRRDKSILYSRATITILVIAAFIAYDNVNFLFLNKGIGIFGGLFHATSVTSVFQIFILLIFDVILFLHTFYPRKVWLREYSSMGSILFTKLVYYQTVILKNGYAQWYIVFKIAIIVIGYFITVMLGLNYYSLILCCFILILILFLPYIFKSTIENYKDSYFMDLLFLCGLYIGILYFLTDWVTTTQFKTNLPMLSNTQVFLLYTFICQMIINLIYGKREKDIFSNVKNTLKNLWLNFKSNPLYFLWLAIVILFVLLLVNMACNSLGISICTKDGWLPYIITLLTRVSFLRLIISLCSLFVTSNIKEWYNIAGMSPLAILILIPSSLCYYFCILPQITLLNCAIVDGIGSMSNNIKEYINVKSTIFGRIDSILDYLEKLLSFKQNLGFIILRVTGQMLLFIESITRFRPGKFLITLADSLSRDESTISRKPLLNSDYTKVNWLYPNKVRTLSNIEFYKFVKSIPKIPPVKIPIIASSVANYNDLIWTGSSFKSALLCFKSDLHSNINKILKLLSFIQNNNTNVLLTFTDDNVVKLNLKDSGLDIKVINGYTGKPMDFRFDYQEYLKHINEHYFKSKNINDNYGYLKSLFYLTDPVNSGYNTNLIVNMQHGPSSSLDIQRDNNQIGESSSLNKGKKRALDLEDSSQTREYYTRSKGKQRALDNTTSDNVSIGNVQENPSANPDSQINSTDFEINNTNPNCIKEDDYLDNGFFDYHTIYLKILNLIESGEVEKTDVYSKLQFEPRSLRKNFYAKIIETGLVMEHEPVNVRTLLNRIKAKIDYQFFKPFYITSDDLNNGLDYHSVYNKILGLIDSGECSKENYISKLKFESHELKCNFYDKMVFFELTHNNHIHATTIGELVRNLEKQIDIYKAYSINKNYDIYKAYSINKNDFWKNSLDCEDIYNKISNIIKENETVVNDPLSYLIFEPESLRKNFYAEIKGLEEIDSLPSTIGILQNALKQNIMDNSNSINKNDFITSDFNFQSIHSKISNLIKLGEVSPKDRISRLKFYPISLKKDFNNSIVILELVNSQAIGTTIRTLMEGLEKSIDITIINPFSINRSDILDDSLNYKSIYIKISNLIKENKIVARDKSHKLIFEPESLRKLFYRKILDLNLSNYKEPSTSRITNILDTLEYKIVEECIQGISTNGYTIKREDFLEIGLDYKSIYIKISNLIKENQTVVNDPLSKLIFEPESLRKDFYAKIKDLGLTNYNEVSKTRIGYLNKKLISVIVKEIT